MWFKEFHGINSVEENLADAAAGENYEWTDDKKMAEEAEAKALPNWPPNSAVWQRSRQRMKSALINFLKATIQIRPLRAMPLLVGNAITADISTKVRKLLTSALFATTLALTLKERWRIIKNPLSKNLT